MKKTSLLALLSFIFAVGVSSNASAQAQKSSELTPSEYQKQKVSGNLQNLFPKEFLKDASNPQPLIIKNGKSVAIPKAGVAKTTNKNPNFQAITTGNCNNSYAYEPPVLVPTADINGDMVTDTIVQFTNGQAPLYRNDDGSSIGLTLPFPFCFYGDTLNSPLSSFANFFVNNNGNISFGSSYTTFTGSAFPNNNFVMIAPFWADVDTRNLLSDVVYMRRMPTYAMFKWHNVGYFSSQGDKLNSFMLIITNGTDPHIPNGLNVAFLYDDMQWTTGSASQGTGGFGGTPATVGANKGDGTNYIQFGLFDQPGIAYDGPDNNNDGVSWLDDQYFFFSSCSSTNNVPPILTGVGFCDTLNACVGDTLQYSIGYLAPENTQSVTFHVIPPPNPLGFSYTLDSTNIAAPIMTINYLAQIPGYVQFQVFATDNGTPPLSSDTVTVTVGASALFGSAVHIDAQCLSNVGSITYNLTQGAAPYMISIDGGNTFENGSDIDSLAGGVYDVILQDDAGCRLDTLIDIFQPVGIDALTSNGGPYCPNDTLQLTGAPFDAAANYSWTNPNGVIISTTQNLDIPNVVSNQSGYYGLTITLNGCPGLTDSTEVIIGLPTANAGVNASVCATSSEQLNGLVGNSGVNYNWSTTGSGNFDDSTLQSPSYFPSLADAIAGTIQLYLTTGPAGCEVTDSLTLAVQAPVTATITSTNNEVCEGSTLAVTGAVSPNTTFTWTSTAGGGMSGSTSTASTFTPTANSGFATVTLTAISTNTCPNETSTLTVTIHPKPSYTVIGGGYLGTNGTTCPPTAQITYNFVGTQPFNFTYSNGTSSVQATSTNSTFNVPYASLIEGDYSISQIVDGNQCSRTYTNGPSEDIQNISFDITFSSKNSTCGFDNGKLIAVVSQNILTPLDLVKKYTWKGEPLVVDSIFHNTFANSDTLKNHYDSATTVVANPFSYGGIYAGDYTLKVTNGYGCVYSETATVNQTIGIIANIGTDSLSGESPFTINFANLTVADTVSEYVWNFGDGSPVESILTTDSVDHIFEADLDTTFTVILTAKSPSGQACYGYDTLVINVKVPSEVRPPNVISTDGDDINAIFKINPSGVLDVDCMIFDRWGNKVHTFTNPGGKKWNGEIWDGGAEQAGTFYYILKYQSKKDNKRKDNTLTGFLQIVK